MTALSTEEATANGRLDRKGSKDSAHAASSSKRGDEESVTVEALEEDVFSGDAIDPVYLAKAHVLNRALQEIGMGKYNWMIFVVTGFGWLACVLINLMRAAKTDIRLHSDNLWPVGTTRCHRWL